MEPPTANARSHAGGLTLAQQSAVDLLAAGLTDTEAARRLGVHRVTITRWRLYNLSFRAALAERRAHVWGAAADRLRALLPRAVDALAEGLEAATGADRAQLALAVLKLAGPLPVAPAGPTDEAGLLAEVVELERARLREIAAHDRRDRLAGLPTHRAHTRTVLDRLADAAAARDGGEEEGADLPDPVRLARPGPADCGCGRGGMR